jgi:hypothetical protein
LTRPGRRRNFMSDTTSDTSKSEPEQAAERVTTISGGWRDDMDLRADSADWLIVLTPKRPMYSNASSEAKTPEE